MALLSNPAAFGTCIEEMRRRRHLSQDELAQKVSCSRRTIINLEAGANVSLHTVFRVLGVLGLALDIGDRRVDLAALRALREVDQ